MPPLFIGRESLLSPNNSVGSLTSVSPPSSPELKHLPRRGTLMTMSNSSIGSHGSFSASSPTSSLSKSSRPPRSRTNSGGGGSPSRSPNRKGHPPPPPPLQRESSNSSLGSATSNSSMKDYSSSSDNDILSTTERSLDRAIAYLGPHHGEVAPHYVKLGNLYFRAAFYKQAADHYKRAIQCDPGEHLGKCLCVLLYL